MQTKEVSILDLAGGAILEQANNETAKILNNILDPNTDATKPRKLTITVTLKSDSERELITCEVQTKSTIAPVMPIAAKITLGEKDGKPIAMELTKDDPNQVRMFDENEELKVIKLETVGGTR